MIMKYKFFVPILLALLLGYICASFILIKYSDNKEIDIVKKVYFIQGGVYNSLDNSKNDFKNINNKLILKDNDRYYVYLGITYSKKMADKVKKIYKENNINTYIKEISVDNNSFLLELEQYDILLKNSKSKGEIDSILETILATYEEDVLNDLGGKI